MKSHDALKNSYEKLLWYKNSNAMLTFTVSPDVVTSTSLQTTPLQHHSTILACQTFLCNFNKFQLNNHSLQMYCLLILNFVSTFITYHDWSLPLIWLPPPQSWLLFPPLSLFNHFCNFEELQLNISHFLPNIFLWTVLSLIV